MSYIDKKAKFKICLLILLIMLFIFMISAAAFGAADIGFFESFKIIISGVPFLKNFVNLNGIKETSRIIVLNVRLPRIIMSALVGAGLSSVGAAYQGIFKNPMADPFCLGVSSGAALGATISIILNLNMSLFGISITAVFAFIGAIFSTLLVYNIAKINGKIPTVNLILSGIAISFFMSSVISILIIIFRKEMERIIFWTMGSMNTANYNKVIFLSIVLIPLFFVLYSFSRDINIIMTGEEAASTLGIDVEIVKMTILVVSSIIVASCVSVSGIIGFVGLIIPHMIRITLGQDNRILLPYSAICGGIFLIVTDTIARTIAAPMELPVGAVTAFFGSPYFIFLLYKSKKKVQL